jgi:hypothetical protein
MGMNWLTVLLVAGTLWLAGGNPQTGPAQERPACFDSRPINWAFAASTRQRIDPALVRDLYHLPAIARLDADYTRDAWVYWQVYEMGAALGYVVNDLVPVGPYIDGFSVDWDGGDFDGAVLVAQSDVDPGVLYLFYAMVERDYHCCDGVVVLTADYLDVMSRYPGATLTNWWPAGMEATWDNDRWGGPPEGEAVEP